MREVWWQVGPLLLALVVTITVWPQEADALFGFDFFNRDKTVDTTDVIPDPVLYSAEMDTDGADEDLKKALTSASQMTDKNAGPVSGTVGLIAAAANEQRRLIGALYAQGYYGGTVNILLDGRHFEDVPVDLQFSSNVVPVAIDVTPGPRFAFGKVGISTPDNVSIDPARFGIVSGEPAKSTEIVVAADAVVAEERKAGHPLARVITREVVADHATQRVDVVISVDPGPEARFGTVSVEGTKRMDPDFVARQAQIPVGAPYSPEELAKARRRLQNLGVFSSIAIETAETLDPDGTIPVVITVAERKPRVVGAGVTYSNTEGAGIEAYWGHRNLFGHAESIRFEGAFGRIGDGNQLTDYDYSAAVLFAMPGAFGPSTKLNAKAFVLHEHPDAYERTAAGGNVSVENKFS
ncbi:MAG: outer membrane protein assembly factor, partial [Rhodobiaceae bacterium]|nr:outer membrane protein assembly factor [Rhodobiaceae bacterium]